jgi:hypothetical protein
LDILRNNGEKLNFGIIQPLDRNWANLYNHSGKKPKVVQPVVSACGQKSQTINSIK